MFHNPDASEIERLLRAARTIAVVGLSADSTRTSHGVARYLQRFGYRVIPVNPSIDEALGERAAPDLEHVPGIVESCIRLGLPALWLQEGVVHEEAAARAQAAGIFTVMDRCIFRDRSALH